jgi:uncharacterized protein YvpB
LGCAVPRVAAAVIAPPLAAGPGKTAGETPPQLPERYLQTVENIAQLPESCLLAVENIAQLPQLPNGCEAASLAIVLNYMGYPADKLDIAYNYIPLQEFTVAEGAYLGGNPEYVYAGNPGGNGYYCYARPVAMAANQYLYNLGAPYRALDCSGLSEDGLVALLAAGIPVIVWKTIDHAAPRRREALAWKLPATGEVYVPFVNLHVVVLTGYDTENFYFCDPLEQAPTLPRGLFMDLFTQMGSRAAVVL